MLFQYQLPQKIYSGRGSIDALSGEMAERGAKKVLVITDQGVMKAGIFVHLERVFQKAGVSWEVWTGVEPEPGISSINEAVEVIKKCNPDVIVAFGGGSAIDTAKIACSAEAHGKDVAQMLEPGSIQVKGRPVIALPTTAGTGSEVTPIAITTVPGQILKVGLVHRHLIPDIAIVDAAFTDTVPPRLTAATGIDALCHAVEASFSRRASPMTEPYCYDAIKRIGRSLRQAVWNGGDQQAREDMSYASLFAGIALSNAGVGAVHAISYPVGGKYHISHGECIALLFTDVLKWMLPAAIEPLAMAAEALGIQITGLSRRQAAEAAIDEIDQLIHDVGLPRRLRDFHVLNDDIPSMASTAAGIDRLIRNSPRILGASDIERIYLAAY